MTIPFRYIPETLTTIDSTLTALDERYDAVRCGIVPNDKTYQKINGHLQHFYTSSIDTLSEQECVGTIKDIAEILHTDVFDTWRRYVPLVLKNRLSAIIDTDSAFACRQNRICAII